MNCWKLKSSFAHFIVGVVCGFLHYSLWLNPIGEYKVSNFDKVHGGAEGLGWAVQLAYSHAIVPKVFFAGPVLKDAQCDLI